MFIVLIKSTTTKWSLSQLTKFTTCSRVRMQSLRSTGSRIRSICHRSCQNDHRTTQCRKESQVLNRQHRHFFSHQGRCQQTLDHLLWRRNQKRVHRILGCGWRDQGKNESKYQGSRFVSDVSGLPAETRPLPWSTSHRFQNQKASRPGD